MKRRRFLGLAIGGVAGSMMLGCVSDSDDSSPRDPDRADGGAAAGTDASPQTGRADAGADDPCANVDRVDMYDTYAQALYLDGTLGPLTGIIYVDYIVANESITLDFWHGHGGQLHRFALGPAQFAKLRRGERVYVTTTEVEDHMHMLFIDPVDLDYRVDGAEPTSVPVEDC